RPVSCKRYAWRGGHEIYRPTSQNEVIESCLNRRTLLMSRLSLCPFQRRLEISFPYRWASVALVLIPRRETHSDIGSSVLWKIQSQNLVAASWHWCRAR